MKFLNTFGLSILLTALSQVASAQSSSSQGHAQLDVEGGSARLTIRGDAATSLYDILINKEGTVLTECEVGSSVVAGAFACNRRPDGTTFCATRTNEFEAGFIPTDICLQPMLSIIGVGSIREVEDDPTIIPLTGGGKPFIPGVTRPGSKPGVLFPGTKPGTLLPGRKPVLPPCLPSPL
jgi:hypothetical protein